MNWMKQEALELYTGSKPLSSQLYFLQNDFFLKVQLFAGFVKAYITGLHKFKKKTSIIFYSLSQ